MTLSIENLSVLRDGKLAAEDVSLSVAPGEVTALLGSNGAGKSELVLAVAGMLPTSQGKVVADGIDITNAGPDRIRSVGVAAVPEGHRVLSLLSVDDNLRAAGSFLPGDIKSRLDDAYDLFPELAERKAQIAGTMSGGQQQMLAIGHALMADPKYMLIDEMSLGLAPLIVKRLLSVVQDLKARGVGILLIEQFTDLALGVADNALVLRSGKVRFSGESSALQNNPSLLDAAYFGEGHRAQA